MRKKIVKVCLTVLIWRLFYKKSQKFVNLFVKVCLHSNKVLHISFIFHEFLDENYKSVRYDIFTKAKKFVKLKDDFFSNLQIPSENSWNWRDFALTS